MLCPNTTEIDISNLWAQEFYYICEYAVRKRNWAMSYRYGTFICCEECYPKAFDLSKGGQVGLLKEEYEKLRIKE